MGFAVYKQVIAGKGALGLDYKGFLVDVRMDPDVVVGRGWGRMGM